ncbi:MAG: HEAT repeat domain-containing protein, partial [Planctomycetota bacterium]
MGLLTIGIAVVSSGAWLTTQTALARAEEAAQDAELRRMDADAARHQAVQAAERERALKLAAQSAQEEAESSRHDAEIARKAAERSLIDMSTIFGLIADDAGRKQDAILWFAHAAALSPDEPERAAENRHRFHSWLDGVPVAISAFQVNGYPRVIQFDESGRFLLVGTGQHNWSLWGVESEARIHAGLDWSLVNTATFQPHTSILAVAHDQKLTLLDARSAKVVREINVGSAIDAVAFSPDGQTLGIAAVDLSFIDVATGELRIPAVSLPSRLTTLSIAADGKNCVCLGRDRFTRVVPLKKNSKPLKLAETTWSDPAVFFAGGKFIAGAQTENSISIWSATTGELVRTMSTSLDVKQLRTDFVHDGFLVGGFTNAAAYNANGHKETAFDMSHANHVQDVAASPDGKAILTSGMDRVAKFWDRASGDLLAEIPHQNEMSAGVFSPSGQLIATAQIDGLIRIWMPPTERSYSRRIAAGTGSVDHTVVVNHSGTKMLPAGWWRDRTQQSVRVYGMDGVPDGPEIAVEGFVNGAALSSRESLAIVLTSAPSASTSGSVRWWTLPGRIAFLDWKSGHPVHPSIETVAEPVSADFAPNGERVLVVCADGSGMVLEADTSMVVAKFDEPGMANGNYGNKPRRWVGYSPDGSVFFTADFDSRVRLRSSADASLIHDLEFDGRVRAVHFSPDDQWMSVACENQVTIFNVVSGEPHAKRLDHPDWVFSARFSPNGSRLLTACRDNTARIWNWKEGSVDGAAAAHDDEIFDASWSADGNTFLTAGRDGVARQWSVFSRRPVSPPMIPSTRRGSFIHQIIEADPRTAIIAGKTDFVEVFDVGTPTTLETELPLQFLESWAEIISGNEVSAGGTVSLTSDQWMHRWRELRTQNASHWQTLPLQRIAPELTSKDPSTRGLAAFRLARLRSPAAVQVLNELIDSEEPDVVRRRTAVGLAVTQDEVDVPTDLILAAIADPETEVRVAAAKCLGGSNSPDVQQRLIELLNDSQADVRLSALRALSGCSGAVDQINSCTKDDSPLVAREAIRCLANHPEGGLTCLKQIIESVDHPMQLEAAFAVLTTPVAADAIAYLSDEIADADATTKTVILNQLATLPSSPEFDELAFQCIDEPDSATREAAIQLLIASKELATQGRLRETTAWHVRSAKLLLSKNRTSAYGAIAAFETAAARMLLEDVESLGSSERYGAMYALGRLGDPEILDVVCKRLADPNLSEDLR